MRDRANSPKPVEQGGAISPKRWGQLSYGVGGDAKSPIRVASYPWISEVQGWLSMALGFLCFVPMTPCGNTSREHQPHP